MRKTVFGVGGHTGFFLNCYEPLKVKGYVEHYNVEISKVFGETYFEMITLRSITVI